MSDSGLPPGAGWNPGSGPKVLFWRHGRTAWNLQNRFQGATDIPLDDVGVAQARSAAPVVARQQPVRIVSSDLARAVDTAAMLGAVTGLPVTTDPALRETDGGLWQGLTRDQIMREYRDVFLAWTAGHDVRPPGGETRSEVVARVQASVEHHMTGIDAGQTLVVVSHGGAIRGGIGGLLGLAPEQWTALGVIANCAWSVLRHLELPSAPGGPRVARWRLEEYNGTSAPEDPIGADDA